MGANAPTPYLSLSDGRMTEELSRFLKFLFESDTGYVYSPVKTKSGEWNQRFFQWPSEIQTLQDWITSSAHDGNVYLAPGLFSEKKADKESFKHANVAWVEFDGTAKIDFKDIPEPDAIVQTSTESHVHCYWKITKANAESIENINRRLTYHLRADNSGWDCTQVLRPPGTLNHKHTKPLETKLIRLHHPLFKRDMAMFDSAPEVEKPPLVLTYDTLPDPTVVLQKSKLSEDVKNMVTKEMAIKGNRSTFLMRLGYLLAGSDLQEEEIVSLLYVADARIKKFVGRSDQLLRLAEIASIAALELHKEYYVEGYSPTEIVNHELELEWRLDGWLHSYGMMILTGQPGVGKTQMAFDIGHSLAVGEPFLGKQVFKPLRVAVLSLEMDVIEAKYIFVAQNKEYGLLDSAALWNQNLRLFAPDGEQSSFAAYEKIIRDFQPDVMIIDSLSELANEDLKETEARMIMRWLKKVSRENTCAIILIHHNRKASDANKKPRRLSDLYGSFIFGKTVSTVVSLWHEDGKPYMEVDELKVRFGKRGTIGKIQRTENLTFKEFKEDANRQSREVPDDPFNILRIL